MAPPPSDRREEIELVFNHKKNYVWVLYDDEYFQLDLEKEEGGEIIFSGTIAAGITFRLECNMNPSGWQLTKITDINPNPVVIDEYFC